MLEPTLLNCRKTSSPSVYRKVSVPTLLWPVPFPPLLAPSPSLKLAWIKPPSHVSTFWNGVGSECAEYAWARRPSPNNLQKRSFYNIYIILHEHKTLYNLWKALFHCACARAGQGVPMLRFALHVRRLAGRGRRFWHVVATQWMLLSNQQQSSQRSRW